MGKGNAEASGIKSALRDIATEARPLIEEQLDLAEKMAELRDTARDSFRARVIPGRSNVR